MSKRLPQNTTPSLSQQMRQAIISTLQAHLPLPAQGRSFDDRTLWELLLYASLQETSIESACHELADMPSGNTLRPYLHQTFDPSCFGVFELETQLNGALQQPLPRSLRRRRTRKGYEVGIDLTDLPYHGQPAQVPQEIRRGPAKSGTTHFHSYATLAIVHHRCRYEVALTFVWADESMAQVVDRLLDQARQVGLRLRRAYLDKGFCRGDVFTLLRQRRLPYLIPIPRRPQPGGIRQLFVGRHSYRTTYTFKANTPQAYSTEVIVLRHYGKGRDGRRRWQWLAYAVDGLDRVPLDQIFELYRRRFGMESGYRQLHRIRARTTSTSPTLRLLLVGVAFLLYNVYIRFRQQGHLTHRYGQRRRRLWLSLDRLKRLLLRFLEQEWGTLTMPPISLSG